jgi:alanyl aminopeptidase
LHTKLRCDGGKATLAVSQSRYLPYGVVSSDNLQWKLPVCVRFDRGGKRSKQCFLLDQAAQDFAVDGGCADAYLPNADAVGYYRFAMDETDSAALRPLVATLPPTEQIIYADSVSSAFVQGTLSAGAVLDAMPALATSQIPQVATALLDQFAWIREYLATDTTRPILDAYAMKLYAPRLAALGLQPLPTDTPMATEMRVRLVGFLAFVVQDKALRQELNHQGRIALGLDSGGTVDLTRVSPDLRGAALKAAVQESGEPAFRAIIGELAVNHQTRQRYEMLAALGATHDAKLGEDARNYGATPAVAVGEISSLYSSHVAEKENRQAFWQWMKTHYESLAARLPDQGQSYILRVAGTGRCSKSQYEELQSWFSPRIPTLIGGQRVEAQSLEAIDQCAALRAHAGANALDGWAGSHR